MIERLPFDGLFKITQDYGNVLFLKDSQGKDYNVYSKFGLKGHNGIDFGLPEGTPVYAPHAGVILEATFDKDGYGNYVKIESKTEGSVLAHLKRISTTVGFEVKAGDLIGISGTTGNSTAPHLHWGYYTMPRNRANGYAGFIDQMSLIKNLLAPTKYMTKFTVGYDIKPSVAIPTGVAPGKETFDYGRVSPDAPAKIIGLTEYLGVSYYNVDQSPNGGTGWVRADSVDGDVGLKYKAPQEVADAKAQEAKDTAEFKGKIQEMGKAYGFKSFAELENILNLYIQWSKNPFNIGKFKLNITKDTMDVSYDLNWLIEELGLKHE